MFQNSNVQFRIRSLLPEQQQAARPVRLALLRKDIPSSDCTAEPALLRFKHASGASFLDRVGQKMKKVQMNSFRTATFTSDLQARSCPVVRSACSLSRGRCLRAGRQPRAAHAGRPRHAADVTVGCHGMRQTSQGSFSTVSKPKFANKYAFESSRRDLHNALLCTALKSHFFF